jgi:hypothetical protein
LHSPFFFGPGVWHLVKVNGQVSPVIHLHVSSLEGLHGRLSLGNPPALKQSRQVYREGTPSLAQAGDSNDRRELALAESKL